MAVSIEAEYAMDLRISEATNDTLKLEWSCPVVEQMYTVKLQDLGERKTVTKSVKADDKSCSVEFTDLQPITHYVAALSLDGQDKALSTIKALTRPTLEMPEIYFVHEGCADLTLAPLPEDQAKHVTGYLLLVQPLEDAKDYPDTVIADTALKLELEALVKPPFYIAYEFTQDQLATDGGGEVRVGSGTAKKDGQYGTIQDPKLTSGAYYRVVLVVITEVDAKRVLFAEESCRMLIK